MPRARLAVWLAHLGVLACLLAAACMARAEAPGVVPRPLSVEPAAGPPFVVRSGVAIVVAPGDARSRWVALWLRDLVKRTRGVRLIVTDRVRAGRPAVVFERAATVGGAEAYRLEADSRRIVIRADGDAGLLWGAVSLWQLLDAPGARGPARVAAMAISDQPRFAWRGLMLDSARHYQSPAAIARLIDAMCLHKLNVLQWHLTDDQAWRLQIRRYPLLTKVGAWRVPLAGTPDAAAGARYGGFYSQAQVRALVAYAARRNITIVPEIEMPGHALAAILAYPRVGLTAGLTGANKDDWGVFPSIFNVDDATFNFLDDVLGEVMELFPSRFIHVGGDEAVKDAWRASPQVQARMKALGIADEAGLQSWFTGRIGTFLNAHGRRLIGWDEILLGGQLPTADAVTSWHAVDGAVAAAQSGHDVVLATEPVLYFDNRQASGPDEPPGRGRVVSLAEVYAYDPGNPPPPLAPPGPPAAPNAGGARLPPFVLPKETLATPRLFLTGEEARHILGLQANLWTEHIRTEAELQAMAFPRAAAVAESGWTAAARRSWPDFQARMPALFARYRAVGVGADVAALVPPPAPPALVRASQQLDLCADKLPLNLEGDAAAHGRRFLIDIMDPCWLWRAAPLDRVTSLSIGVAALRFNYQLGADRQHLVLAAPVGDGAEIQVRLDGCAGPLLASAPLDSARTDGGVARLSAPVTPHAGVHDLCFALAAHSPDPLWAIGEVRLGQGGEAK
jgi:hexosaminidase